MSRPGIEWPQDIVRVGTAIEVVNAVDDLLSQPAPGVRHWTPHLITGGVARTYDGAGEAACGKLITGMVLTPGTMSDVGCEECLLAYVTKYLRNEPEAPP